MSVFDQLGEGVFRRRYESLDLNVGVVLGEEGLLIVDTRSTLAEAYELSRELTELSSLPVRWIVNTHWHWDHTFGNSVFTDAVIWGHDRCRDALIDRGDEMKDGALRWFPDRVDEFAAVDIVAPQNTFAEKASVAIGREVSLTYHGLGHTDADILVNVADADVTFAGDLVEESAPPAFGDSYPVMWPLTLRLAMDSMLEVIVPGHGDVVDRSFVRTQHDELVAGAELATRCVERDLDLDEAAGLGPFSEQVMKSALTRALEVA